MAEELSPTNFEGKDKRLKYLVGGFFFFGLFLLSLGAGLTLLRNQSAGDDIQIISPNESGSEIVIHVDGAVVAPGVYRLPHDSRVSDALERAGGFSGEADTARVNLAAKLADGQKILIPKTGEKVAVGEAGVAPSGSLINVNTASEKELDTLPGIGPVTAQKIIASRPYSVLEDLLTKQAVSASVYEKIKDLISVY